jgi:beta-N-acetylhexosaminidase
MRLLALVFAVTVVGLHAVAGPATRQAEPPKDAPKDDLKIIDKPIPFDDERVRLTLAYRRQHSDPDAKDITIEPRVIVLHYTAGRSTSRSATRGIATSSPIRAIDS